MLTAARIDEIAHKVAIKRLPRESVDHVESEDATDSEGREAVRILIVLKPGAVKQVDGDAALDTLVDIQSSLSAEGEDRLALVEYASSDEVDSVGDPES